VATGILFLAACWATLQFRFVGLQFPVLAHAAENILLVAVGPLATSYLSWAMLSSAPPSYVPVYTLILSAASVALYIPPLPSSYLTKARASTSGAVGGSAAPAGTVQLRTQCALLALHALLQPSLVHIAINGRHMTAAPHLWSLVLLLSGSIMCLQLTPRALWWLPEHLYWARIALWLIAYVAGVAALEQRVVLVAFGSYVKLPSPWSWIIVTAGMYLGAALVIMYFGGLVPILDPGIVGVMCIAVCTAGGISIGLPTHILPFCLIAGAGAPHVPRGMRYASASELPVGHSTHGSQHSDFFVCLISCSVCFDAAIYRRAQPPPHIPGKRQVHCSCFPDGPH
jgi:hypothetical protein